MIFKLLLKRILLIISVAMCIVFFYATVASDKSDLTSEEDAINPWDALGFSVVGNPVYTASGIWARFNESGDLLYDIYLPWDESSDIQLVCDDEVSLTIGDKTYHNGDRFLPSSQDYIDGKIDIPGQDVDNGKFRFICTGSIPSVYMNTYSEDKNYLTDEKGNTAIGRCTVMDGAGKQDFSGDCSLKVHGNTSWFDDKKSYQFNLDYPSKLLGMSSQRKWILLARHEAYMTDTIMYQLARDTGDKYAPDFRYVNVFLNGQYEGMYLLIQKISIEGGTIKDIYDLETANNMLSDSMVSQHLTGGYMGEVLGFLGWMEVDNRLKIQTPRRWIRVRSPNNITSEQADYLTELVNEAEVALYLPDGERTKTGHVWSDYFDKETWIRQFLLQEISANMDADNCSQYFYVKENDRRIYGGPAWDFDRSLSHYIDNERLNYVVRLVHNDSISVAKNEYGILWMRQFDSHQDFHQDMKKFFFEVAEPKMLEILDDDVPVWQGQVADAVVADAIRWDSDDGHYQRLQDTELQGFRDRLKNLHDYYSNEDDYYTVTFLLPDVRASLVIPVLKGNTIGEDVLPIFRGGSDWYCEDELFTLDTVVDRDMVLTLDQPPEDEAE